MAEKAVMTTGTFKFDGTTYGLTDMTYNESVSVVDLTDTSTTGDGKELVYGRVERKFTADIWTDVSGSDIPLKTKKAIELHFENKKYVGSGSLETRAIKATIDTGIKSSFTGQFSGVVLVTP